jgi:branched-chain amino acid transport system substrate-binding protein
MAHRSMAWLAAASAVALAGSSLIGCNRKTEAPAGQPKAEPIVIGHVGSMTGNEATFGDSADKGLRLAVDEQNKAGGIKGKTLEVKTLDDQGKPEEAAIAATRLVTEDGVLVLVGEETSSRSLAMAPIADSNHVPMISPSATNPRVTKEGGRTRPFVFRTCFIDPFQGTVMAKFAREQLKATKVAVLRDVGNDYSVGLAQYFTEKLSALGGKVVSDQSYKAGDSDFKAQLTTIKATQPEAIYVPGYYTDVGLIARQARELGMNQPLMGGDGWDSTKLFEVARGALDGSFYSNHYSPEAPSPLVQDFVAKYKGKFGVAPDGFATLGYDTGRLLIDAMLRAKELSGQAIREALEQTRDLQVVSGTISIDADHNPVKSAVVLAIEKNAPKYSATVNP